MFGLRFRESFAVIGLPFRAGSSEQRPKNNDDENRLAAEHVAILSGPARSDNDKLVMRPSIRLGMVAQTGDRL